MKFKTIESNVKPISKSIQQSSSQSEQLNHIVLGQKECTQNFLILNFKWEMWESEFK